jgi:ubiquinone/menaquinone biosynthesis C-methylase UbiE
MNDKKNVFDFASQVGLTKQLGGVQTTDELAALCHIRPSSEVLDVGCGAGVTSCYLAEKIGCAVVGVDILDGMIEWSKKQAERRGVTDRTEFRVADAQELPFEDNRFDAVFTESVTAFPSDQEKALQEYVRVTKPGGYVGLNESTWLKANPPPEVVAWWSAEYGGTPKIHTEEGWVELMRSAGLKGIIAKTYDISLSSGFRDLVGRYGLWEMLKIYGRMFSLYRRSADYREFIRAVKETGRMPAGAMEYFGYGIYVGQK